MKGIGVSPGIAIGRAFVIKKTEATLNGVLLTNDEEISREKIRFENAVGRAVGEIEAIKSNKNLSLQDEDIAILDTQIELLTDPQLKDDVIEKITSDRKNSTDALIEVIETFVQLFEGMDDEYMRARAADIKDIGNRIFKHLDGGGNPSIQNLQPNTIIIAEDISPSETITMDIVNVVGFATQVGSKTSHTAIIARAKGIPAVVGCGDGIGTINNDDLIILDGINGVLYIDPPPDVIADYAAKKDDWQQSSAKLKTLKNKPAITIDGEKITLSANIGAAEEFTDVFEHGGEGVGLLRTELLFMNRDTFPTENEQLEFYKNVALQSKGVPVIIRTIDIGGDKHLSYFNLPAEPNPFLGYRAIRICLDRKELFITQLRAILRASVFGDLRIMFPMISNLQEVRSAKQIVDEAKTDLSKEGIVFNADIQVGIMIEIPSAAIMADILAKEVDFFSIGTNDLCQYTLAVDRMNEKIAHLYDPFSPGVLRLISNVIEQGHKQGIHVGLCGEMASNPMAALLLLGMGLDNFSMSASAIPAVKDIIINHSVTEAKEIYKNAMQMDSSEEIIAYLKQHLK